jgi:nucleotide-binding universal stress UspA family protein
MIRVLVPVEAFGRLSLSATYFALEFAKRHPAKVFFLILAGAGRAAEEGGPTLPGQPQEVEVFQQLLARARQQQVDVEVLHSDEEYLPAIRQAVAAQGIDDLVIAVPAAGDPLYPQLHRRLEQLRHQVQCHIITVKPKEVGPLGLVPRSCKPQN